MTVEIDDYPVCIVCGRWETYAHGVWYCRFCDAEEQ